MPPRRRTLTSPLSVGHSSFETFLTKSLHDLQVELVRECERIAVARELHLKEALQKASKMNEELHAKNLSLARAATGRRIEKSHTDDSIYGRSTGMEIPEPLSSAATYGKQNILLSVLPPEASDTVKERRNDLSSNTCDTPVDTTTVNRVTFQDSDMTVASMSEFGRGATQNMLSLDACTERKIVSLDSLPTDEKLSGHLTLWQEWREHASFLLKSVSAETLDLVSAREDSTLELNWIQRQAEAGNSDRQDRRGRHASPCTLSPTSTTSLSWDVIGVPVLIFDLIMIPLQVFYKPEGLVADLFGWAVIMYWTVDMFLNFFIFAYVTGHGDIQYNRKRIMKRYLLRSFPFDLLLLAPDWLSLCIGAPRNVALLRTFRIARLMRVFRMSKLRKITRKIQDAVDSEYYAIISSIVTNLIAIGGACHYLGCFWFWLGVQEVPGYKSWVEEANLVDVQWEYQYSVSLFWAVTQFTPGGSKVQPTNIPEAVVAIMVLIFGMVFFSLFISSLTQERMRLKALTSKMDRDCWILRRYLTQHGVSTELTRRAIRYVDASVAPVMNRVQRSDVVLLKWLSKPLQLEVQAELFYTTLLVHPFLARLRKYSLALISHLFTHAVLEVSLAQNDLLFTVGQVAHEMYFLSQGQLAYLLRGTRNIYEIYQKEWCCEPVIWLPWVHTGTARAVKECHLISIDSAKMRTAVLEHRERVFVRQCAQAYLTDINELIDEGLTPSDVTNIVENENSNYMQAIHELPGGTPTL